MAVGGWASATWRPVAEFVLAGIQWQSLCYMEAVGLTGGTWRFKTIWLLGGRLLIWSYLEAGDWAGVIWSPLAELVIPEGHWLSWCYQMAWRILRPCWRPVRPWAPAGSSMQYFIFTILTLFYVFVIRTGQNSPLNNEKENCTNWDIPQRLKYIYCGKYFAMLSTSAHAFINSVQQIMFSTKHDNA